MPDAANPADRITVLCPCGKKLKAPRSAVGRKAKCPACGSVVVLTAPEATPTEEAPQEPPAFDDFASSLDELAAQEAAAAARAEASGAIQCPGCSFAMPTNSKVCMNCGFDLRTGVAPKVNKPVVVEAPVDLDAPRPFIVGVIMSAVFATAAAIGWIAIVSATGRQISWLEIFIGVFAGIGMRVGLRKFDANGALVAAGITLVLVVGVRWFVIYKVVNPSEVKRAIAAAKAEAERQEQEEHDREIAERSPAVVQIMIEDDLIAQGFKLDKHDPLEDDDPRGYGPRAQVNNSNKSSPDDPREPTTKPDPKLLSARMAAASAANKKLQTISKEEYNKLLDRQEEREITQMLYGAKMDGQLRSMGLNPDFQRIHEEDYQKATRDVHRAVNKMTPKEQRAELKKANPGMYEEMEFRLSTAKGLDKVVKKKEITEDDLEIDKTSYWNFWGMLNALLAISTAYKGASGLVPE